MRNNKVFEQLASPEEIKKGFIECTIWAAVQTSFCCTKETSPPPQFHFLLPIKTYDG